jgi:serine/threonine protein kinase
MKRDGCPPLAELRRYLDQSFDTDLPKGDPLAAHLVNCSACRRMLEENTEELDAANWRQLWAERGRTRLDGTAVTVPAVNGQDAECGDALRSVSVEGFEILSVLGRGGSGVVYKARQIKLNRTVALKMLAAGAHASRRAMRRLRAESETIARFKHPNVVTIHDVGEHLGVPYLCLELVEGGSLAEWLSKRKMPLPPLEAARVVAALAQVVQEAHNLGIIHRDLKPANVLLAEPSADSLDSRRLKLTDFGLAKRLVDDDTASSIQSGIVLGTPSYMAPEQAGSGKTEVGPAVDVYGLGAILYELLTLKAPFRGDSPIETVLQVLSRAPERPSRLVPAIPSELEVICLRCLEKDASHRYASAAELGDALDGFINGLSLSDPRQRLRSWAWGRRAAKMAAGCAALTLLAAVWFFVARISPGSPEAVREMHTAPAPFKITTPASGRVYLQGEHLEERGQIEEPPRADVAVPVTFAFDLSQNQFRYLDNTLTKNARVWTESAHDVVYWGPVDDRECFEVVYKFPFDFAVQAASLHASLNLADADAFGRLEVSKDPRFGWSKVSEGTTMCPVGGPFDISHTIRGARQIYVRALMKGRDDQKNSSMAQFLRTSTRADGHIKNKGHYVFELRAFDRDYPIVTASMVCTDGRVGRLWVDQNGEFALDHFFDKPGHHVFSVTAFVGQIDQVSESFDVWVNSKNLGLTFDPKASRTQVGGAFSGRGILNGSLSGPWTGEVDYADGSGPQNLAVALDGRFILEHRYKMAGKYELRVTLKNRAGEMVTDRPNCIVVAPSNPIVVGSKRMK